MVPSSVASCTSTTMSASAAVTISAPDVKIGFVDRFNGSLVFTGDVAAVEASLRDVMKVLCDMMGFSPAPMTKT